jgi:integrase
LKLTPAAVRSLTLPAGEVDRTFWDADIAGFGLRLRKSGSRNWILQYDHAGRTRRLTLGAVSEMDAGKARATAMDLRAQIRLGRDPAGEKAAALDQAARSASETFGALLPRYLNHKRASVSRRWFSEIDRHLGTQARSFHKRPAASIGRRDVAHLLAEVAESSGPVAANRLRTSLIAFFTWIIKEGLVESNPAALTNVAPTNGSRTRVLTDPELVEIWHAIDKLDGAGNIQFGTIARLLMLTGLRRTEVGSLRWAEVDLDAEVIRLPAGRTKSKQPHLVPLAPLAAAVLRAQPRRLQADGTPRDFVFGSSRHGRGAFGNWGAAKRELDQRISANRKAAGIADQMPGWGLHDLRRTVSTRMNGDELGVMPHVVEAVLGHVVPGVAGVYNRAGYERETRIALERWDGYINRLVAAQPRSASVTKARRRRDRRSADT